MSDEQPEDLGFALPAPAVMGKTRGVALAAVVVVALAAAFFIGYLPKRGAKHDLRAAIAATEKEVPRVEVVQPKLVMTDRAIVLPGGIQALEETVIYPRAGGYVKRWLVDLGDKVKEGQLLAEIDAPEVDKALAQARAELAQARAQLKQQQAARALSRTTLGRYQTLGKDRLVADAEVDQKKAQALADEATVAAAAANVEAQEANVARLKEMTGFSQVTAPFAGTIIERAAERGALVTGQTPLFKLAATEVLRVFVQVPQDVAAGVRPDVAAQVTLRERPEQPFPGKVARSAGALDPALRTMTTEVRVPNPDGHLMPGMYVNVALSLPAPHRLFELPATSIFNDAAGVRVAVVDGAGKIAFVPVTIERDTGAAIEISTGLQGDERVVKLASAALSAGTTVEVAAPAAAPPPAK